MGLKQKRGRTGKPTEGAATETERQLKRGNYKEALKEAKVGYRREGSEQHRRLLEIAHIARAQELQRHDNRDACRGVVESLLHLGVREPAVQAALPDVLIWLGMMERLAATAPAPSEAERHQWAAKTFDNAVLRPASAPAAIGAQVHRVRQALEALYRGDAQAAHEQLRDVPRDSPMADWKIFVRGLAAYYEQATEPMRANWSRLDPNRIAARIARKLDAVAEQRRHDASDASHQTAVASVEREVSQQPVLTSLRMLQVYLAEGEWAKMFQAARGVCDRLQGLDPALSQRLVRCLLSYLIKEGDASYIDRLARQVGPLPLDPRWNRAKALVWEELAEGGELWEVMELWRAYIRDLAASAELPASERELAQALVWHHLAGIHARAVKEMQHCTCGASHDEQISAAAQAAGACLEECLRLAPAHLPAYRALAELHIAAGQTEQAAAVYRRALVHVADDLESLLYLTLDHLCREEAVEAECFALRALEARPLDQQAKTLVRTCRVTAARQCVRQGDYPRGRAWLEKADELFPQCRTDYDVLARKAVLEAAAGCIDPSRRLLAEAQDALEEPTPLWLAMFLEAEQMGLPQEAILIYEKRWREGLERRGASAAAGRMCALAAANPREASLYRLPRTHAPDLVKYVRKCLRVKWTEPDLHGVCTWLLSVGETELLRKFVRRGQKKFPASADFHALEGELEMSRGPLDCNRRRAKRSLERALDLLHDSSEPADQRLRKEVTQSLTMLNEFHEIPRWGLGRPSARAARPQSEAADLGAAMKDLLSPEMKARIEAMCRKLGVDPDEAMERLLQGGLPPLDSQPRKR